ncbi:protein PFC0760c [Plutella xylostella]|uniref:protein PFC0760c n=1 Tax=Plutella xylostella TaxID=51655 RepID=UPI002032388C|nr:protein PFC0760c [Plutella xylostella]
MDVEPCTVCGNKDLNLVDGFYYCSECGTQDMTIRETIIEGIELGDGKFQASTKKKINRKKPKLLMSKEWNKWHAYNFILSGLCDELIALGASPSLKSKVLWVWTRYIKKFHNREEYETHTASKRNTLLVAQDDDDEDLDSEKTQKSKSEVETDTKSIRTMSFSILYGILYVSLNLDKSPILLSHFMRYIKEGRLSFFSAAKYLPSDINVKHIPQWPEFLNSLKIMTRYSFLRTCFALFKTLDLGSPWIPDLKEIANEFIKELCLPKDFRNLVFSLMELLPYNIRLSDSVFPDFETRVMAYILLALKLCFGLDDDYDKLLSDVVDEVNEKEEHLKCYRVGLSEHTERLFSFREWLTYLEFRKIVLCKFYQPMASKHQFNEEDFLVTELLKDKVVEKEAKRVVDQLSFELLNTIPLQNNFTIVSKEDFPVSLTPLTGYTEFILPRIKDQHMRLLLSEDFSRYSLKYACLDLTLNDCNNENVIKGVTDNNKKFNDLDMFKVNNDEVNKRLVFVKDDETKDWIKEYKNECHLYKKLDKRRSQDSDDSDSEDDVPLASLVNKHVDENANQNQLNELKIERIDELEEGKCIFNDYFDDIKEEKPDVDEVMPPLVFDFSRSQLSNSIFNDSKDDIDNQRNSMFSPQQPSIHEATIIEQFDPSTFDRDQVIKDLILRACKKYKIPVPYKYNDKRPVKRKLDAPTDRVFVKRRKDPAKYGKVNDIVSAYYSIYPTEDDVNNLQTNSNVTLNDMNADNIEIDTIEPNNSIDNDANENLDIAPLENLNESNNEAAETTNVVNDETICNVVPPLEDFNFDFFDDDAVIEDIVSREINEFHYNKKGKLQLLKDKLLNKFDSKKTEMMMKDKKATVKKAIENRKQMKHLLETSKRIKRFQYYFSKHNYIVNHSIKIMYMFEQKLKTHFPKSFKYVLTTCADILETSAYHLYCYFTLLERRVVNQFSR